MERIWIKFWIKLLAIECEFACTHAQLPKEDTTRGAPLADMLNNSVVFQLVVISAKRRCNQSFRLSFLINKTQIAPTICSRGQLEMKCGNVPENDVFFPFNLVINSENHPATAQLQN
jgi:hypothetical protein